MPKINDNAPMHSRSLRILYIRDYLMSRTDIDHGISLEDIQEYLNANGISAERKTVYSDIEALQSYGCDIELHRGKFFDYRVKSRFFEDAEISLLVNAVESCKFITRDKSLSLISKLGSLTSESRAKSMKHNMLVDGRVKNENESIYDTADAVYSAINTDSVLRFRYFRYGRRKQRVYGHNGKAYRVRPLGVFFSDSYYYVIAYSPSDSELRNYRMDRMSEAGAVSALPDESLPEKYLDFDLEAYTREMFSMFGGDAVDVKMQFSGDIASQVVDRFGSSPVFIPEGDNDFRIVTRVVPSPGFYSWIASFAGRAKILDPPEVVSEYREMLVSALEANKE